MSKLSKAGFVTIVLLFLSSCAATASNQQVSSANINREKPEPTGEKLEGVGVKHDQSAWNSPEISKGLVVLSDRYGKNDFVRFYNADGTLWYEFTFYYDDRDGKFEYANDDFAPFGFHPDNFQLALKCTAEDANRYEVIVNEDSGLKKFVRKDASIFKFETWEQHILKSFAVGFRETENPVRDWPAGSIVGSNLPTNSAFHPVEIQGDWLKVRWNAATTSDRKSVKSGWIRWKENDRVLIELFYTS